MSVQNIRAMEAYDNGQRQAVKDGRDIIPLDPETGDIVSIEAARRLTDQIRAEVERAWGLICKAYTSRTWAALGYESWDAYCAQEFGQARLRLPREDRREVVASLRDEGLSIRAIAAATGTGTRQVQEAIKEQKQVWSRNTPADEDTQQGAGDDGSASGGDAALSGDGANSHDVGRTESEPAPTITGTDGKSYPAAKERTQEEKDAELVEKVGEHLAENVPELVEGESYRNASKALRSAWSTLKDVDPDAAGRGCLSSSAGDLFMERVDAIEMWLKAFRRAQRTEHRLRVVRGEQ